jgi:hypothetical protein
MICFYIKIDVLIYLFIIIIIIIIMDIGFKLREKKLSFLPFFPKPKQACKCFFFFFVLRKTIWFRMY